MSQTLQGPRLKVIRAISEIERLSRCEQAFRRESNYHVVKAEFNSETGKDVYRVCAGIPPDPEWGVWIGEIAHNLRSALDAIVYQLVIDNAATPTSTNQFPITLRAKCPAEKHRNNHGFWAADRGGGLDMLKGVASEHHTDFERLQPYKRCNTPSAGLGRNNLLYLLRELNNADKHRLIQVVGVRARQGGAFSTGFSDAFDIGRVVVLEHGAKWDERTPGDVDVQAKISPQIAFDKGCRPIRNRLVCPTLHNMAARVSEVVETFAPLCKG